MNQNSAVGDPDKISKRTVYVKNRDDGQLGNGSTDNLSILAFFLDISPKLLKLSTFCDILH